MRNILSVFGLAVLACGLVLAWAVSETFGNIIAGFLQAQFFSKLGISEATVSHFLGLYFVPLLVATIAIVSMALIMRRYPQEQTSYAPLEEAALFAKAELGSLPFFGIGERVCQGAQDATLRYYVIHLIRANLPIYSRGMFFSKEKPLEGLTALSNVIVLGAKVSVNGTPNLSVKKSELSARVEHLKIIHPRPASGSITADGGSFVIQTRNKAVGGVVARNVDIIIQAENEAGMKQEKDR